MKTKGFQLRLDEEEHKKMKIFCIEHGISMQEFVSKAIREYKRKWVV